MVVNRGEENGVVAGKKNGTGDHFVPLSFKLVGATLYNEILLLQKQPQNILSCVYSLLKCKSEIGEYLKKF